MNKRLAALDAHLRERNDRDRRRLAQREPLGLPPMPAPGICRWCGGKLKALIEGEPADFCQNLCAPNDKAPYLIDCAECGRECHTGKHRALLCPACERRDVDTIATVEQATRVVTRDAWAERRRRA